MTIASLIPSMFLRRLALLMAIASAVMAVLGLQLFRLTVLQGAEFRAQAERKLVNAIWLPTQRGQIKDRHGRILARDKASFDIAFTYDVVVTGLVRHAPERLLSGQVPKISRTWAEKQAIDSARRRADWADLNDRRRIQILVSYLALFESHIDRMWDALAARTGADRVTIDGARNTIRTRIERRVATYVENNTAAEIKKNQAKGRILTDKQERMIQRRFESGGIAEQNQSHVILPRVGSEIGFRFFAMKQEFKALATPDESSARGYGLVEVFPGLDLRYSGERQNPYETMDISIDLSTLPGPLRRSGVQTITVDGVACHILGGLHDTFYSTDVDRRKSRIARDARFEARVVRRIADQPDEDLGQYRLGDRSGFGGIEGAQEHVLRGLRGRRITMIDTQHSDHVYAEPGRDVQLTIDIELQARVQAVMTPEFGLAKVQPWHGTHSDASLHRPKPGEPLFGAAVVLDIDTGEILALVSTPTYSSRDFKLRRAELHKDPLGTPLVNRAIAKPYPPGSIAKALMLVSAITSGNFQIGRSISCTGHLIPTRPDILRCWIFKNFSGRTHDEYLGHEPSATEALMVSCNIFFYTIGQRLGGLGVRDTYRMFGLGRPLNIGLGENTVYRGPIDLRDDTLRSYRIEEAIQMAIGQGPVDWTPLHAADAYATIARGGLRLPPTLIRRPTQDRLPQDLDLSPEAIAETLEGLRLSVNSADGTGHHLTLPDGRREPHFNVRERGVDVWGKTGTADAPPIVIDTDGDEKPDTVLREGDHSWFIVLAAEKGAPPRYAITVVMDYAGSGGRVSGPIANQIVHALCDLGYLKDNTRGAR